MSNHKALITMRSFKLLSILFLVFLFGETSWADPIQYELSGTATGTLGTQSFTGASFTFTGYADTTGVFEIAPGVLVNPLTSGTVTLSGFGSADVLDPFYFYVNQGIPGAGLIDLYSGDVIDVTADAFSTYDNASSIGPIAVDEAALTPFDTTNGTLSLSSLDLQFTATVAVSSVPEPSTGAMCGIASVGCLLLVSSRRLQRN